MPYRYETRRMYFLAFSAISVITVGIVGYMQIEGMSLIQAVYMTIITVSTVGFAEVVSLSDGGRMFTVILIFFSFGVFATAIGSLTKYVIDGEFQTYLKHYRMNNKVNKLDNHVIVCGFGRNGKQACIDLLEHDETVMVIEKDNDLIEEEENFETTKNDGFVYVHGDATQEKALLRANIGKAKALITTLPSDADNLFVVLTARGMNKNLTIISRASALHTDAKLKLAGANNVIMPDRVGGARMAKLVTQPDIVEFVESLLQRNDKNVTIDEISCDQLAHCLINKNIGELGIRKESGANLIGLKRKDQKYIYNPAPDIKLNLDDKLIVLGTKEQVEKLKKILIGS